MRASFSQHASVRLKRSSIRTRDDDVAATVRAIPDTVMMIIVHAAVIVGTCAVGQNDRTTHDRPDRMTINGRADIAGGQREQNQGGAEQMLKFHGIDWVAWIN